MTVPLDAHAHIEVSIAPSQLTALGGCVFAMTRSLDEFDLARERADPNVVWAVGCHPGLVRALKAFDPERFASAAATCPVIGEVGLDGSRGQPEMQLKVFDAVLGVAADQQRLVSIHSYQSTTQVLAALRKTPVPGAILHWWLGDDDETRAVVDLGAYFSINASQARRWSGVRLMPPDRVLLETDHPFGDRSQTPPRHPGRVDRAEKELAAALGLGPDELRRQSWANLNAIVSELNLFDLFPRLFQIQMLAS